MKKFLFSVVLLTLPLLITAQNKKVAVYVMGEDAGVNKVLGSKLQTAIASSEEYTAIERTAAFLAELSKEQKYQRTGAVDDNDISRLGKQFGVQYVCVAAVSEAFNEKYITARLIDVESAQVEGTASSSGVIQSLTDIISAANKVSEELLSSLQKSRQSGVKKVAVYIVKNDAARNIGRVLGDKLVAGFTNSGRYVAIERTNSFLNQLSKEQKYQRTGAVDDGDISRLGKQFGVQYVCVADVSDVLGEKFISARLIDVETAEVVKSHDIGGTINRMEDCIHIANELADNLSGISFQEQSRIERQKQIEQARILRDSIEKTKEYDIFADRHGHYEDSDGKYIDLGLPSGILWKENKEKREYDYYSAMDKFGNKLPTVEQWEELKKYCTWVWQKNGYKVIGPNNKSIFLRDTNSQNTNGATGHYWAYKYGVSETSARRLCFSPNDITMDAEISTATSAVCLVNATSDEILKTPYNINERVDNFHITLDSNEYELELHNALQQFGSKNLRYPVAAQEQGIQGRVFFSLIVEKSGRITNILIGRAPKGGGFSEEVIRVLKLMSRWKPCMEDNSVQRFLFHDHFNFRLQ